MALTGIALPILPVFLFVLGDQIIQGGTPLTRRSDAKLQSHNGENPGELVISELSNSPVLQRRESGTAYQRVAGGLFLSEFERLSCLGDGLANVIQRGHG